MQAVKQLLKPGSILCALALLAGCAKPPTQEMTDAQNAVNTAIQAGAEEYAADELNAAQDALADAGAKVESKDYKAAKTSAMEAKTKADAAGAAVEANKQAAKDQAEQAMAALKTEIQAVQDTVAKMKGKGLETLKADALALNDQWTALQAEYDGGRYKTAMDMVQQAQAKMEEVKAGAETAKSAKK